MSKILLLIKQQYDLSDEETWLLSGLDRSIERTGYAACDKAKEVNIFGTGQILVDYKNRDNLLTALIGQGLVLHRKVAANLAGYGYTVPQYHGHQDTYILSQKVEDSLPMVCPQGRTWSTT